MATRQEEIIVKLGADTKALARELGTTTAGVKKFAREVAQSLQSGSFPQGWESARQQVKNYRDEIGKLSKESQDLINKGKAAGGGGGGGTLDTVKNWIMGGALISAIKKTIDYFDDLADRAANLSISTDFLQGINHIASKDVVGGVGTMNKALDELSNRLGQAKDGSEEAAKRFAKLGISVQDIQTLDTEGMFYLIADRIKAIPDPAMRVAAAFEMMGKAGKNMAGQLALGGSELKKMVDGVEKLSETDVQMLAKSKDDLQTASNRITMFIGAQLSAVGNLSSKMGGQGIGKWLGNALWGTDRDVSNAMQNPGEERRLRGEAQSAAAAKSAQNKTAAKAAADAQFNALDQLLRKQNELANVGNKFNQLQNEEFHLRQKLQKQGLSEIEQLELKNKIKQTQIQLSDMHKAKLAEEATAAANAAKAQIRQQQAIKEAESAMTGGKLTVGELAAGVADRKGNLIQGRFAGVAQDIQDLDVDRRQALNFGNINYAKELQAKITDMKEKLYEAGVIEKPVELKMEEHLAEIRKGVTVKPTE